MLTNHVLVIDDEELIRRSTQVCLEATSHWKVSVAGSGKEGLAIAQVEQPDVILLDLMMPSMDGLDTFQKLQSNPATQPIRVLLLTAKLTATDNYRFFKLGLAGVISKPFDPLTLAAQITATFANNG